MFNDTSFKNVYISLIDDENKVYYDVYKHLNHKNVEEESDIEIL